jgi:hypothetical protein
MVQSSANVFCYFRRASDVISLSRTQHAYCVLSESVRVGDAPAFATVAPSPGARLPPPYAEVTAPSELRSRNVARLARLVTCDYNRYTQTPVPCAHHRPHESPLMLRLSCLKAFAALSPPRLSHLAFRTRSSALSKRAYSADTAPPRCERIEIPSRSNGSITVE